MNLKAVMEGSLHYIRPLISIRVDGKAAKSNNEWGYGMENDYSPNISRPQPLGSKNIFIRSLLDKQIQIRWFQASRPGQG